MTAPIKTLADFKKETKRLLGILAANINDDYYSRNAYGDVLNFDNSDWVTFNHPDGFATPHIELRKGLFNYVVSERGQEFERVSGSADEILFKLLEGITHTLASNFEVRNRIDGQDSRKVLFAKQIELFGLLNPEWVDLRTKGHKKILQKYPFDGKPVSPVPEQTPTETAPKQQIGTPVDDPVELKQTIAKIFERDECVHSAYIGLATKQNGQRSFLIGIVFYPGHEYPEIFNTAEKAAKPFLPKGYSVDFITMEGRPDGWSKELLEIGDRFFYGKTKP